MKVTTLSTKYDLNTQVSQIENFIANKIDLLLVNAVDPKAIAPVLKKARDAGIVVVAVDVGAEGADYTVMSDNVLAGANACEYIAKKLNNKGNVVIASERALSSSAPQSRAIRWERGTGRTPRMTWKTAPTGSADPLWDKAFRISRNIRTVRPQPSDARRGAAYWNPKGISRTRPSSSTMVVLNEPARMA